MADRTVQSVKNSLKFKAQPKAGILSVKVGVKKYQIPIEARMLSNEGYMFLSFPACSELFRVESKNLQPMDAKADAAEAFEKLNPGRRRRGGGGGRRGRAGAEMPPQLAEALRSLPEGFRLGYNADGTPKLIRTRKRGARKKRGAGA